MTNANQVGHEPFYHYYAHYYTEASQTPETLLRRAIPILRWCTHVLTEGTMIVAVKKS